jgi:hypothetical protein
MVKQKYGITLRLSAAATRRIAKGAGLAYVPATATVIAGQNQHLRPDIVDERTVAGKEGFRFWRRVIKCAPENRGKVVVLIERALPGHVFTEEEQRLLNVELRWITGADGVSTQERPILYLNHDEKVFWAHDGATKE